MHRYRVSSSEGLQQGFYDSMIGVVAACLSSIIYGLSSASNGIGVSGVLGICVQPVSIAIDTGWTQAL